MKLLAPFSTNKNINSLFFNLIGIQPFRYLFAKLLYNLKILVDGNLEFSDFRKNGYSIQENFLEKEQFDKIKEEFNKLINDKEYTTQENGNINVTVVKINKIDKKEKYPEICSLLHNEKILNFFKKNELRKNPQIHGVIERVKVVNDYKDPGPSDFHHDTFHNTFKTWLYISDIKDEDGPLHVVPNTHKFSLKRLFREWTNSIAISLKKYSSDGADVAGSLRYGNSFKEKQKLDKTAIKFLLKKNTFLKVNTHGLHRRGDAKIGGMRDSIHIYTRENPFKVFFQ